MYKWLETNSSRLKAISISGDLTYDILLNVVTEVEDLERQNPDGFDRFSDLRKVENISLDSGEIRNITNRRHIGYLGPPVRSAILASDPAMYGVMRIYAAMMEPSSIEVGVFYTLEECTRWLGVDPGAVRLED